MMSKRANRVLSKMLIDDDYQYDDTSVQRKSLNG